MVKSRAGDDYIRCSSGSAVRWHLRDFMAALSRKNAIRPKVTPTAVIQPNIHRHSYSTRQIASVRAYLPLSSSMIPVNRYVVVHSEHVVLLQLTAGEG
jgi:hypothetical protein